MKKAFLLVLIIVFSAFGYNRYNRFVAKNNIPTTNTARIETKAKEALTFCKKNNYNEKGVLPILKLQASQETKESLETKETLSTQRCLSKLLLESHRFLRLRRSRRSR